MMYFGDTTRRGRPFAKDPAVVRFQEQYLLYYSIPPFSPEQNPTSRPGSDGWGIGIARSTDLTNWERIGELIPDQPCEMRGICAPGACVLNGQVHLFYQTYGNGPKDAICHAVSNDGFHFEKDASNPIFSPTGAWNNGRAIDADVIPWQDDLLLFFSSRDPTGQRQIGGVASAPLNSTFHRETWKQLGDGPIMEPTLPWERQCIEAAALCEHDGRLWMFYAGAYNNEPQQIGCAACVEGDPTRWERVTPDPILPNGEAGTWNSSESGHPFVFTNTDGNQYLFFQGNNDNGHTWYLSCKRIYWREQGPYFTN